MVFRVIALVLLITTRFPLPSVGQVSAPSTIPWITSGDVYALARSGSTVFIGGQFDAVAPRSGEAGALAMLQTASAHRACDMPRVNGTINVIEPDGAGGFFIGGWFTTVDDESHLSIAHVFANCALDRMWTGGIQGTVNAMAVADGVLYVGGMGMNWSAGLAAFRSVTGESVGWNPQAGANVTVATAMKAVVIPAPSPHVEIYVALQQWWHWSGMPSGFASTVSVFLTNGTRVGLSEFGLPRSVIGTISQMALEPASAGAPLRMWIAGDFQTSLDAPRRNLAVLHLPDLAVDNVVTPYAYAPPCVRCPNPRPEVTSVVMTGSSHATARVYIAGTFTQVNGAPRQYVAALTSEGTLLPFAPNPNGPVLDVVPSVSVDSSTVYLGGQFTKVNDVVRLRAARVDSETGTLLDWNPSFNGEVRTLRIAQTDAVVAGGAFTAMAAVERHNLAAFHLDTGWLLPFAPKVNNRVNTLAVQNDVLYAGGEFTAIDGQVRNRLASFAAVTRALTEWDPNAGGSVTALVVRGDAVFLGGRFGGVGSETDIRESFAVVDATSGALSTRFTGRAGFNGRINTLLLVGDTIYVGGEFSGFAEKYTWQTTGPLIRIDATSGAIDSSWKPVLWTTAEPVVQSICMRSGALYVAGNTVGQLTAIDLVTGATTGWQPTVAGKVNSVSCSPAFVYAGGDFFEVGRDVAPAVKPHAREMLVELRASATGPDGAYATAFAQHGLEQVKQTLLSSDGLLAGAITTQRWSGGPLMDRVAFFPQSVDGVPSPPIQPTVAIVPASPASQMIRLHWSAPPRGPRPTRYYIEAGPEPGSSSYLTAFEVANTAIDVVAPVGVRAFVRIRAATAAGVSEPSQELSFVTASGCAGPPDSPVLLGASTSGTETTINWQPATNGVITGYRIDVGAVSGRTDATVTVHPTATSFRARPPSGVYYARVRAMSDCGISAPTSELAVVVPGSNVVLAPVDVAATVAGDTVTITWQPPPIGSPLGYRLEAGRTLGGTDLASVTTAQTRLKFSSVPPGTYYIRVSTIAATGTSGPSDDLILHVPTPSDVSSMPTGR